MFDTANGAMRYVTRAGLVRNAALNGRGYVFDAAGAAHEQVLHGRFDTLALRPGLVLHAACVRDLRTMSSSNRLHPGVKIVLVVDGATDMSFGHHRLRLGPAWPGARGAGGAGESALVNLAEEDLFTRRWIEGRSERKASLTLTPEWMENGGFAGHAAWRELERFCGGHLARAPWSASPRAAALARRILAPAALAPGMARLRLEAYCIELAAEALQAIGREAAPPAPASLPAAELRRLARLEELLQASAGEAPSVAAMARELGSNPVSLQALTRRAWGCTVYERLREIRMGRARTLLAEGASVALAAEAAGFNSAANFSTAYRKRYGASPRRGRAAVTR